MAREGCKLLGKETEGSHRQDQVHRVGGSLQGPGAEDNCLFTEAGETQGESVAWKPVLSLASIPKYRSSPNSPLFPQFFRLFVFQISHSPGECVLQGESLICLSPPGGTVSGADEVCSW